MSFDVQIKAKHREEVLKLRAEQMQVREQLVTLREMSGGLDCPPSPS